MGITAVVIVSSPRVTPGNAKPLRIASRAPRSKALNLLAPSEETSRLAVTTCVGVADWSAGRAARSHMAALVRRDRRIPLAQVNAPGSQSSGARYGLRNTTTAQPKCGARWEASTAEAATATSFLTQARNTVRFGASGPEDPGPNSRPYWPGGVASTRVVTNYEAVTACMLSADFVIRFLPGLAQELLSPALA